MVETVTYDLSSDGFYCLTIRGSFRATSWNAAWACRRILRKTACALTIQCRVRVIRVEALGENRLYGVGCHIEDYRFLSTE